tara:strand:+ start:55730 stop:56152 length:423 start_codon:yes stop_codon:yes gene_type:complete
LTIDDKGRLAIPACFRKELAECCASQMVITRGPNPCLEIYPANEFQRIADEIDQMEDRQMAETLKGIVIGLAVQTELDKQGRVLLPTLLRKHARLNGAAVLMGQIRRFDLWPDDLWNERYGDGLQSIDAQVVDAFRTLKR